MKKIYNAVCFILLISLLVQCYTARSIVDLGNKTAKAGSSVTGEILKCYALMGNQAFVDQRQQEMIRLLSYPDPRRVMLPAIRVRQLKSLPAKINAFTSLQTVYKSFETLTDGTDKDASRDAMTSLLNSYFTIKKLPDLPHAAQQILPGATSEFTVATQANKVKEQNEVLGKLSAAYLEIWKKDLPVWKEYIDRIYLDYAKAVYALPESRFDPQAIKKLVNQPVNTKYQIIFYKDKVQQDAKQQIATINDELDQTTYAFETLIQSHQAVTQRPVSVSAVSAMLNSINSTLGAIKK